MCALAWRTFLTLLISGQIDSTTKIEVLDLPDYQEGREGGGSVKVSKLNFELPTLFPVTLRKTPSLSISLYDIAGCLMG